MLLQGLFQNPVLNYDSIFLEVRRGQHERKEKSGSCFHTVAILIHPDCVKRKDKATIGKRQEN